MKEKAVVFGEGQILSGVVSLPSGEASRTGVLLFNAGIIHRVGPGQLHVRLARALAHAGFPVIRFDLSGLGESEARSDNLSYEARTLQEAQQAMDVLARSGAEHFIVFGICSGADNGFRVALGDTRVVGAALVAFLTFSSRAYKIDRYVYQIATRAFWKRALRGQVDPVSTLKNLVNNLRRPPKPEQEPGDVSQFWTMPPPDRVIADFRTLVRRRVKLLLIYSHRSPAEYIYRSLLRKEVKALGLDSPVETEMFVGTDHTLTPLPHQARLVAKVVEWVERTAHAQG